MKQYIKYIKIEAVGVLSVLVIILICLILKLLALFPLYNQDLIYTNECINNTTATEFLKINPNFEIGLNKYGDMVFKNPENAFQTLKDKYKDGIKLIKKEFKLPKLKRSNYQLYKTYGWQVSEGTLSEKAEAKFISRFLDIYENSFKR